MSELFDFLAKISGPLAIALILWFQLQVRRSQVVVDKESTIAGQAALTLKLAEKVDGLQAAQHAAEVAALQDKVEAARREGELKAQIAALTAANQGKDEALAILKRLEPQNLAIAAGIALANQQLTATQEKLSQASSDTPEQTAAAKAANVRKDYDSTQGKVDLVLPADHPDQQVNKEEVRTVQTLPTETPPL